MENENEGWAKPIGCKAHHYFRNGETVCYNGFVYHGRQFETPESAPKKCKVCKARLTQQERAASVLEKWIADTDKLLSFMRQFQASNGRAPSLSEILEGCPVRASRTGISQVLGKLGEQGLAEQRTVNEPGQREHKKWWALNE